MKKGSEQHGSGILLKLILGLNILMLTGLAWVYLESKPRIAYVQSGYLLANYQGFKDASVAFQQKSSLWKANIDTLESQLNSLKTEYSSQKSTYSKKEKELSEQLIQTKEQQLAQYRSGIQQKAYEEDKAMTAEVVQEVNLFLKEYGQQHGYKMIFGATEAGSIVFAEDALNLTETVLEALNARYEGKI